MCVRLCACKIQKLSFQSMS